MTENVKNILLQNLNSKFHRKYKGVSDEDKIKLKTAKGHCRSCDEKNDCVNWCKKVVNIFNGND